MGFMKEIWQGSKILTKCAWLGSKFDIKNTPAAIGMLWEVKKELNSALAQGLHDAKVEYKRHQLETKINQLNSPCKPINNLDDFAMNVQELLKNAREAQEGRSNA